ncbi:MAG: beta(1,3)galactosyltransferase EpsH [Clostridiales Family XIII bacterium]|nr:beta(1,3)galactosyltransferase EpsH [Clostridiales Family XIII bacterium]
MIFAAIGTQNLPFDRLLIRIDELVESGFIQEEVFAQIGHSPYEPKRYRFERMIPPPRFDGYLDRCDIFLSHGGTGSLVGALKRGKRVVAVPRLRKYGEHVDDHQTEIISLFEESGLLIAAREMDDLEGALRRVRSFVPRPFVGNRQTILKIIEDFIENGF